MQTHMETDGNDIVFNVPVRVSRSELTELMESQGSPLAGQIRERRGGRNGSLLEVAKSMRAYEEARKKIPGLAAIFGDPAWMILLDLYVRGFEGKTTSVSSATLASGSPATTGLRYVTALVSTGHIIRTRHPYDERSVLLTLSNETQRAISDILENVTN